MKRDIFDTATMKMTGIYLIIIMCISLLFSFALYQISIQELERGLKRPLSQAQQFVLNNPTDQQLFRLEQFDRYESARNRVQSNLLLLNILILIAGGGTSYMLARKTLRPIKEAHEAQSRFTADASHELRTPITAMRAENELTLTDDKLTVKKAKEQLQSNIEELDKLTELSEGLLRLARLDHNSLEKESISATHIVEQSVERVKMKAEKKKQIINTSRVGNHVLSANQSAIIEAVVILLDNAIKYSPISSEISVATHKHGHWVDVAVSDSGIGIKASELPHIFDRFYRADQSRTQSEVHGYGIGLSIAKSVADAHGGKISVKSSPENGSTFTLSLPAA